MISAQERPPIPNRAEEIVFIGQNMLSFFNVLHKWERAYQKVMENPTPEAQKRYKKLDEIVRKLMNIIPEMDEPID